MLTLDAKPRLLAIAMIAILFAGMFPSRSVLGQDRPTPVATPIAVTAPAVAKSGAFQTLVRPRPAAREFVNPASLPNYELTEPAETASTESEEAEKEPTPLGTPRLDDPVLRWLPEIVTFANEFAVPPELVAAVMRIESQGNPNPISPAGARGLMQIMPDQLLGQGISADFWHDPATNIRAGAYELWERQIAYGSWEGAVGSYLGFGCDIYGTCTDVYIRVVFGWAEYYRPIIADPYNFGFGILPASWLPPAIIPFQMPTPPTPEPPPPTSEPDVVPTEIAAPQPTGPNPTEPTTIPAVPTTLATEQSTGEPTEISTAVPTEIPTTIPTAIPTEASTEAPPPPPTEPPPPSATEPPPPPPPPTEEAPPVEEATGSAETSEG